MENIQVNFKKATGIIKPEHAVNGGPLAAFKGTADHSEVFREIGIPYARYHDIAAPYGSGQFIDIHCIFPDFSADEMDEKSYNFDCTDDYIKATVDAGTKPFYRLGESIDHSGKNYYINPPKDFFKWARICEHIIRHYNEGWANGFHYDIEYWEIWNEPEGVPADECYPMWTGTKEQFYELYAITAKHLKDYFGNKIKVGGYSAIHLAGCCERCKDIVDVFPNGKPSMKKYYFEYFTEFLKYIQCEEHKAPLEFFTFHQYFTGASSILDYTAMVADIKKNLEKHGFNDTEIICAEWNLVPPEKSKTMFAAANVSAMMIASQKSCVDMAMYYMLREPSGWNGVVAGKTKFKPYYALKIFGELYRLGTEVETTGDNEILYTLGAKNDEKEALIITNLGVDKDIKVSYTNCDVFYKYNVYIVDEDNDMSLISKRGYPVPEGEILIQSTKNSIVYIEFTR